MDKPACMGGWCESREWCNRYTTPRRWVIVERLCPRGLEEPETMDPRRREEQPREETM